jgi:hypothetical protein
MAMFKNVLLSSCLEDIARVKSHGGQFFHFVHHLNHILP